MVELDNNVFDKLKNIQLEILKEYIRICEKYNLMYYIIGGSCIGALRHKGFIPWDDDIDVGMPRPDYDKFMEIAASELPEYYFLQNADTDPDYPMCFAKIRDSRTSFFETSVAHLNINHGVYFDIFPLDGLCTSTVFKIKKKIYTLCVEKIYRVNDPRKGISKLVFKILSSLIPDYRKARDKLDSLVRKYRYEDHEISINYFGAWGYKEQFSRDKCLGKGSEGIFEGITVKLPEDPDGFCRQVYGDYMQLPPEEKRVSHHCCDIIDTDRSYTEYLSAISR